MQGMIEMVMPACSMPQSMPPMLPGAHAGEHQRQGEARVLVHDDERGEELVPRGDEGEERRP